MPTLASEIAAHKKCCDFETPRAHKEWPICLTLWSWWHTSSLSNCMMMMLMKTLSFKDTVRQKNPFVLQIQRGSHGPPKTAKISKDLALQGYLFLHPLGVLGQRDGTQMKRIQFPTNVFIGKQLESQHWNLPGPGPLFSDTLSLNKPHENPQTRKSHINIK